MNIKNIVLTALTAIGLFSTGMLGTEPVYSETASDGFVRVEMNLVSTKTPAPGQPIILHYSVYNASPSESVTFFVGDHGEDWYKVRLVDAHGQPASALPKPQSQPQRQGGLYQLPERSIQPGQRLQGSIVVTRFLQPLRPGKYNLGVEVSLVGSASSSSAEQTVDQSLLTVPFRVSGNFTFPVAVTPDNPTMVRRMAEDLRRRLMRPDAEDPKLLMQELFSLPETAALSSWRTLISDPAIRTFTLADAAEELSGYPSAATADLLGQIVWRDDPSSYVPSEAQTSQAWAALAKMYETASPVLKQQIKAMYLAHGIPASEVDGEHIKSHPN